MIKEKGNVAHYTRLENLANILYDKKIMVGHVNNLGDARESSMGWLDTIGYGHSISKKDWLHAQRVIDDIRLQLRVLSVTSHKDTCLNGACPIESSIYGRPRMWAQYGDNSKGFCLILNKQKLHSKFLEVAEKPEHLLADNIDYIPWLHQVNGFSCLEFGDGIDIDKIDIFNKINENHMLKSIYFRKSIDWQDEQEFRWLIFAKNTNPIYLPIDNIVEAVVIGWKFPINQRSQVKSYCKELNCDCYALKYIHPKYEIEQI